MQGVWGLPAYLSGEASILLPDVLAKLLKPVDRAPFLEERVLHFLDVDALHQVLLHLRDRTDHDYSFPRYLDCLGRGRKREGVALGGEIGPPSACFLLD